MSPVKALHHVEQLARIVVTFESEIQTLDSGAFFSANDIPVELSHGPYWSSISLVQTIRELRLALVQLDIARSAAAPSIYEASDR